MQWTSVVSSVFQTIGGIVGGLLGVNSIEDGVICFSHQGVRGADQEFSSIYFVEDGKYYLFNQSGSRQDFVTMTFPSRGNIGTESVTVEGRGSFNITPFFQHNAKDDNSEFQLTASSMSQQQGQEKQEGSYTVSASGSQLSISGTQQSIGAYLAVQVNPQQLIVTSRDQNRFAVQNLPFIKLQCSGDTAMQFSEVQAQNGQATIALPQPLAQSELLAVDVMAQITPQQPMSVLLMNQPHAELYHKIDDKTAQRILKAPRLNWR